MFVGMGNCSDRQIKTFKNFLNFFKKPLDIFGGSVYNIIVAPIKDGKMRKFSSAGRASALQAEGHRFEPYNFHHPAR